MRTAPPNPPRNGEGDRAKRGGGGSTQLQRPVVYTARRLRKEMSPPEVRLWSILRTRPGGLKFRRQHPIAPYVVDFCCRDVKLVIEVDGEVHSGARAQHDERRDARLQELGFRILRIPAVEVMRSVNAVVEAILARAGNPLHQPSAGPPPRPGEDF